MKPALFLLTMMIAISTSSLQATAEQDRPQDELWVVYEPDEMAANGRRIVLIAGDDEYRSEEALPMLGQILCKHHGFHCTVLFPVNPETGLIQPTYQKNIPGMETIAKADLVIMGLRFRNLPDADMKQLDDFLKAGKPVIGLRTSTHAFKMDNESKYRHYSFNFGSEWKGGFGRQVLGDTWINHHGHHKRESTRGVINEKHADHVVLKGVNDVWGNTDVYGVRNLTDEATILLYGQVLQGMKPDDKAVEGRKNDPMMPLAWLKPYQMKEGKKGTAFCTTMGSSTDFENAHLRRLIVNISFFLLDMKRQIDGKANVDYVSKYEPTMYGFGNFKKNIKPAAHVMNDKE